MSSSLTSAAIAFFLNLVYDFPAFHMNGIDPPYENKTKKQRIHPLRYSRPGFLVSSELWSIPARVVEMVPAIVAKKRKALTAKPLLVGETVFKTIVMHGDNQLSATRYSSPRLTMENQKLFWTRQHMAIVGIPSTAEKMQT